MKGVGEVSTSYVHEVVGTRPLDNSTDKDSSVTPKRKRWAGLFTIGSRLGLCRQHSRGNCAVNLELAKTLAYAEQLAPSHVCRSPTQV